VRDTTDGWVCSSLYKPLAWYLGEQPVNFAWLKTAALWSGQHTYNTTAGAHSLTIGWIWTSNAT